MNQVVADQRKARTSTGLTLILGLGLLVCAVAISSESFWIDECGVAYKAKLPGIKLFWERLSTEGSADLQQPFHHFFTWAWEKMAGIGEFGFRAGNIPFFLMGLAATFLAFRKEPGLQWGFVTMILTSAFAWSYLNEARPYSVQIGASLIVFSALYRLGLREEREGVWVLLLCFGMVLLSASGMLAMLWLGGYLLAAAASIPVARLVELLKAHKAAFGLTAVLLLAIGLFYVWTVSIGARATAVGGTDLRNLGFIGFELLGAGGVGPGRLAIREEGLKAFVPWAFWIVIYGALAAMVFLAGLKQLSLRLSKRQLWVWPAAFGCVAGFILAVGVAVHFRVLGRHWTPVLPLVLFLLANGLVRLWVRGGIGRLASGGFLGICVVSCLMMRFGDRHAKDDYRSAAGFVRSAVMEGKTVWWNANPDGAVIYGLPIATNNQPGTAVFVANPQRGFETGLTVPDVVVTSKPDVYDATGALGEFLKSQGFSPFTNFVAFTVWTR